MAVLDACFKALLVPKENGYLSIAFILRNDEENHDLKECACTVDQLESLLGLDLLFNLPDNIETEVESTILWLDWGF